MSWWRNKRVTYHLIDFYSTLICYSAFSLSLSVSFFLSCALPSVCMFVCIYFDFRYGSQNCFKFAYRISFMIYMENRNHVLSNGNVYVEHEIRRYWIITSRRANFEFNSKPQNCENKYEKKNCVVNQYDFSTHHYQYE